MANFVERIEIRRIGAVPTEHNIDGVSQKKGEQKERFAIMAGIIKKSLMYFLWVMIKISWIRRANDQSAACCPADAKLVRR